MGIPAYFYVMSTEMTFSQGFWSQMLELLLLAGMTFLLTKAKQWPEYYKTLPVPLLIWANFHASSVTGIIASVDSGSFNLRIGVIAHAHILWNVSVDGICIGRCDDALFQYLVCSKN